MRTLARSRAPVLARWISSSSSAVGRLPLAFYVRHLAADHAIHRSRRRRKFPTSATVRAASSPSICDSVCSASVKQSVARQNRHGFAEDFMARRFAAPVIVVIERRQIVVNQRVGVDHLQRAAPPPAPRRVLGNGCRARHTKDRAYALSARKQAVAHGLVDGCRMRRSRRRQPVQRLVHRACSVRQIFRERHHFSGRNGSGWYVPSLRVRISTRVSASSSCFRHVSLSCMPREKSSSDRSSGRSPDSSSLTTFSSSSRQVSKLGALGAGGSDLRTPHHFILNVGQPFGAAAALSGGLAGPDAALPMPNPQSSSDFSKFPANIASLLRVTRHRPTEGRPGQTNGGNALKTRYSPIAAAEVCR